MSLNYLKTWSINQKIVASVTLLIFSILLFGAIASFFIQDDLKFLQTDDMGERLHELARKKSDNQIDEVGLFKGIQQLILDADLSILNRWFYVQIGYNLFVFLGLSLVLIKCFEVKELKSLTFKNKSFLLFLVAFVLAISVPKIGKDATYINELIGLDVLQEFFLGIDDLDDKKSLISQYILFFPNADRGWIITVIGLALIPAVGEELMFRGYLMKLISQESNYHNGIAISASIFALVHFNFSNFFYYFVLGVVMGYVYYWGKNLFFPILIHFVNNALVVFFYYSAISGKFFFEFDSLFIFLCYILFCLSMLVFYLNFNRNKHIIK